MGNLNCLVLAVRNVRRQPFQSLVIATAIAFASACVLANVLIASAVRHSLEVTRARLGADLIVIPEKQDVAIQTALLTGEPTSFYMPDTVAERIAKTPGVARASPQLFVESLSNASCCSGRFFLVGFDPETDFTVAPWIRQTMGEKSLAPNEIIVGGRITLKVGEKAKFYGTEFTVAGVLDKTGMGIDSTVFIPIPGVRRMIDDSATKAVKPLDVKADRISAVMVKMEPGTNQKYFVKNLVLDIEGVNAVLQTDFVKSVNQRLGGMSGAVTWMTLALWILAVPLIGTVFSMVIHLRKKEIALLRAMGARRAFVFRLVLLECLALCLAGAFLGSTAGAWITYNFRALIGQSLQAPLLWPDPGVLLSIMGLVLLGATAAGCLAGLVPAIRNSRMEPHDVLRVVV